MLLFFLYFLSLFLLIVQFDWVARSIKILKKISWPKSTSHNFKWIVFLWLKVIIKVTKLLIKQKSIYLSNDSTMTNRIERFFYLVEYKLKYDYKLVVIIIIILFIKKILKSRLDFFNCRNFSLLHINKISRNKNKR